MNAHAWDTVAAERAAWLDGRGLGAAFFAAGGVALDAVEREHLGDLRGRRVLHLQCATGEDTLSLANLGARATGVDISAAQVGIARAKAAAAGLDATFETADVQDLPAHVRQGDFDVVYTGLGALVWLDDLDGWASGVAQALSFGGRFVLYEAHPIQYVFEEIDGRLVVVHSAFDREPEYSHGWNHFPTGEDETTKAEFTWTVGAVVSALGRAGVATITMLEMPRIDRDAWERFPGLLEGDRGKVPAGLLLVAVRLPAIPP